MHVHARKVRAGVAALAIPAAAAVAQTVVIPSHNEEVPGNHPWAQIFAHTSRSFQWVVPGADLATVPGADTVDGLRLRTTADGVVPFPPLNCPNWDVYIGELAVPLGVPLNARFHENVVPGTEVKVRSGPLILFEGTYPTGQSPNGWGPLIEFNLGAYPFSPTKNYAITVRHDGCHAGSMVLLPVDANVNAGNYRGIFVQSYTALTSTSQQTYHIAQFQLGTSAAPCYANCDGSTAPPVLNVADFTCFLAKFAGQDLYANCDGSTQIPVLNIADFTCFLVKFAGGCG